MKTKRIAISASNSLLDGWAVCESGRWRWKCLDWSKAWIDKGPSPAGNQGPYLHVPFQPYSTGHRVYPKIALWIRAGHPIHRVTVEPAPGKKIPWAWVIEFKEKTK